VESYARASTEITVRAQLAVLWQQPSLAAIRSSFREQASRLPPQLHVFPYG
jgi:hypothetical protein